MKLTSWKWILGIVIVALLCEVAVSGITAQYRLSHKPSDEMRHASFEQRKKLFTADRQIALGHVYFVFSSDSDLQPPHFDRKTQRLAFAAAGDTVVSQGLAIAVEDDGYLLTASHVLGKTNFVMGLFDGSIDLRPARVVYRNQAAMHADVALIKTEGKLAYPVELGEKPSVGDPAFAVVCYRTESQIGGNLDFAAGEVLDVNGDTANSVESLNTDIPLWECDSGGPQLSRTSQLIGITTGYELNWYGPFWTYRRISFLPDKRFVNNLIAKDRAVH